MVISLYMYCYIYLTLELELFAAFMNFTNLAEILGVFYFLYSVLQPCGFNSCFFYGQHNQCSEHFCQGKPIITSYYSAEVHNCVL